MKNWDVIGRVFVAILLFGGLLLGLMWKITSLRKRIAELENAPADTVTVYRTDTLVYEKPVEVAHYIKEKEYITVSDTTFIRDTVTEQFVIPKEVKVYRDSTYKAVVSGFRPSLDSITVYQKTYMQTITKTVTRKVKSRWGLGPQVGVSFNGKQVEPTVGIGVQFNILSW